MAEENNETNKSSWNFSADHSKLAFEKLRESQKHKSEGNIGKCFDSLKELFDLIEYNIEEKVVEDMDKRISIVNRRRKYWDKYNIITNNGNKRKWTFEEEKEKINFEYGVRKIQRILLRLLKDAGHLPNKVNERDVDM